MRPERWRSNPMTKTLVTTAKNEGPYFLEWVAYHRLIGFDKILVFQNDSDDLTHDILTELAGIGAVRYFYNRAGKGRHQVRAYKRAARQPEFRGADWVMALDMDEFLNIQAGAGHLDDLIAAVPEAAEVLINWRRFGHDGNIRIDDRLVVEKFQRAEPDARVSEWLTPFKTLFRPGYYARCGIHQARGPLVPRDRIVTVNGSGLPRQAFQKKRFRIKDPKRRALAQVNHYITLDAASFVLKSDKGSAHQAGRDIGRTYWNRRNFNHEPDRGLARRAPEIRAAMAELDAQSGGRLSDLRARSTALHQQRFEALLGHSAYRALYEHCAAA